MRLILIRVLGFLIPTLLLCLAVHLLDRALWELCTRLRSVDVPASGLLLPPPRDCGAVD
jgi:hypothetical protein